MPIPQQDKPLDSLREETIDQLIVNYGHGKLSLEAFQRRLDRAFEAADHAGLIALTADLNEQVDAAYVQSKEETLGPLFQRGEGEHVESMVSVLSGNNRGGVWHVPSELRVFTILGGTDLDFTNARFSSPVTRIKLLCVLGGVDIGVPEGVNTTVTASCVLGGIDNSAPNTMNPAAPKLIIEGVVLLGGVDIKQRKTLRERLLAFADGLRAMFTR